MTTASPEPKKKEPLPYRAAMIGVWAPIIAIVVGVMSQSSLNASSNVGSPEMIRIASLIIAVTNGALILTGFIAAVIALAGVRNYGKKDLLTRGIVGLLLNGFFLLAFIGLIFLFHPFSGMESRIAGRWHRTTRGGLSQLLEIKADKSFHLSESGEHSADIAGTWRIATANETYKLVFVMTIVSVSPGALAKTGETIPWGIDKVDSGQLVFLTSDGGETYNRVPNE